MVRMFSADLDCESNRITAVCSEMYPHRATAKRAPIAATTSNCQLLAIAAATPVKTAGVAVATVPFDFVLVLCVGDVEPEP
jgi:hypothetical protein